jgi:hypothetical protein
VYVVHECLLNLLRVVVSLPLEIKLANSYTSHLNTHMYKYLAQTFSARKLNKLPLYTELMRNWSTYIRRNRHLMHSYIIAVIVALQARLRSLNTPVQDRSLCIHTHRLIVTRTRFVMLGIHKNKTETDQCIVFVFLRIRFAKCIKRTSA